MPEIPTVPVYNLSLVDVCSNALNLLGQPDINALDETDQTEAANMCKRQLPTVLSAMLRDHDWSFNRRRVYLPQIDPDEVINILLGFGSGGFGGGGFGGGSGTTQTVTEPTSGYLYWYALPNNFLRAWQINNCDDSKFTIEYGSLLADDTPVLLKYGAYVNDPNLWDAMFRMGIETLLASRLCGRLTGNLQRAQALKVEALDPVNGIFAQAKAVVGQEGTTDAYIVDDLTDAIREI